MKRFSKILALLIVSLFLVASGVNAALDRMARLPSESSFTVYTDKGIVVAVYNGDLACCKAFAKPGPVAAPSLLHRT